jgi:Flp pilus assembly pilin Flp
MRTFILNTLRRIKVDEKGVTLVEYGIALALAVGVGTAALSGLSGGIQGGMTAANNCMPVTGGGTVGTC